MEVSKPPESSNSTSPDTVDEPTHEALRQVRIMATDAARFYNAGPDEVEDVAQETVIAIWRQWNAPHIARARKRQGARWRGYVRKTAKNKLSNMRRGNNRRVNRQLKSAGARRQAPARPMVNRQTGMLAADEMQQRIELDFVLGLFEQLPERQRTVATLVVYHELTPAEAAQLLGVDPQTVRKSLRAARERLKELIQRSLDELDTV